MKRHVKRPALDGLHRMIGKEDRSLRAHPLRGRPCAAGKGVRGMSRERSDAPDSLVAGQLEEQRRGQRFDDRVSPHAGDLTAAHVEHFEGLALVGQT